MTIRKMRFPVPPGQGNPSRVAVCRHCGNKTPQEILHNATTTEDLIDTEGQMIGTAENYYFLTKCSTCHAISLYITWEHDENPEDLLEANVLYPMEQRFLAMVPKDVRSAYAEARKVKQISPASFVVMIRRALEVTCHARSATGRNLRDRIQDLIKREKLPETLGRMADAIRTLGNDGAHEMDFEASPQDTEDLDDFFSSLIEYVYIAPKRLDELETRMAAAKQQSVKEAKP